MNDDPNHGATKIHSSKGGGGGGKWLAGALAAAVLVGGGYYVWKNMSPNSDRAEIAYNDGHASEPMRAGPMDPSSDLNTTDSTINDDADTPTAAPAASALRPAAARRSTVRTEEVPVETIGVTPASTTIEENDDIIVTAPRRPVWTRTPSARRLEALYPARALEREREGEAMLHCTVQEEGALACERASETPGGGFGHAAMRIARTLRHAETFADGASTVGSPVNLRVVFRISDEEPRRERFASR